MGQIDYNSKFTGAELDGRLERVNELAAELDAAQKDFTQQITTTRDELQQQAATNKAELEQVVGDYKTETDLKLSELESKNSELSSSLSVGITDAGGYVDVTNMFLKKYYCSNVSRSIASGILLRYDILNAACAVFKVKVGDKFKFTNLQGGAYNARAWILYDLQGKQVSYADASIVINGELVMEQDGYLIVNYYGDDVNAFKCEIVGPSLIPITATLGVMQVNADLLDTVNEFDGRVGANEQSIAQLNESDGIIRGELYSRTSVEQNAQPLAFESNTAYALEIGSVPIKEAKGSYMSVLVSNLDKTDVVSVKVRSGSSYPTCAKIKNGLIVEVSKAGLLIDDTIVCDGTFDALVFNNYADYISDPTCIYTENKSVKTILTELTQEAEETKIRVGVVEDSVKYINERECVFESKTAYSFTLGAEPIKNVVDYYKSVLVDNLVFGDSVAVNVRAGTSYPTFAKLKEGVIVEVSKSGLAINDTIVCDGTFDALVFNNYTGYINSPTCVVYMKVPINGVIEELSSKVEELSDNANAKKSIKILCFGNSFTQDSMSYVPFILKNVAPNVELTLGIAYIGGCPLVQHCANFTGETTMLGSTAYEVKPYTLQKYYSGASKWVSEGSKDVDALLGNDDWDVITFQQNGGNSASDWDTYYKPYIYKIHKALYEKVSKPVKLGWLSVHGSYKTTFEGLYEAWQGTVENSQKIENLTGNQVVFPFGTAVQNLRTTPLVNLGDGGYLMGDTAHLHEGIGCLAAAYANALKVLELVGVENVSIIGEKTRPTKEWCTSVGVPAPNYGDTTQDVVGITEDNCYTAQIAAIMAVKKPYEVTDCNNFYTAG